MFKTKPRKRKELFDNFIKELNMQSKSTLQLPEDTKSKFLNEILSKDNSEINNKGKFISTFYYPHIVDIRDIKKNRDIKIFTPIPKSMEILLEDFYKNNIENSELKFYFEDNNLKLFPLTFTVKFEDKEIKFNVTKIEKNTRVHQDGNTVYFESENKKITIKANFINISIIYPYFIYLNGNKYEIRIDSCVKTEEIEKKTQISNNMNKIKSRLDILENSKTDLENLNKDDFYKEIFPETNNPCLENLKVRIKKLKEILEEQNKQLEDINTVDGDDEEKIEVLRDGISKIGNREFYLIFEEKKKINESLKKLLYFQFIQNLSNYYYGENRYPNISEKIKELVSILTKNPSVEKNTYPNTLVPYLTNQLKYLIKTENLIENTSTTSDIQLRSISDNKSFNNIISNVNENKSQLSNSNSIDFIFYNIIKYFTFTYAFEYNLKDGLDSIENIKIEIEKYFKNNYK